MDSVSDKYERIKQIGRGALSVVHLVREKETGKLYASKETDMRGLNIKKNLMVGSEIPIMKSFNSSFVVRVHDFYRIQERLVLVLEYCE